MTFTIPAPPLFRLSSTVYSHGWSALPPFHINREERTLDRVLTLAGDEPVVVTISQPGPAELTINCSGDARLDAATRRQCTGQITTMLRLTEDFGPFFRAARRHPHFRWIPRLGAGRMLSCPTVFEDIVKMICTTNCSWALTEIMVGNLCKKLGVRVHDTLSTFPTPSSIASGTERFLRKEIRAGYRAPYLLEFARRIDTGEIDPERWRHSSIPTEDLFRELRSIKGVGPYAAGNILKLLGRYDYLGIDSWCRKRFSELHRNGRKVSDATIERQYKAYGTFRGLFFWLDMTQEWYRKAYPF